MNVLRAVSYLCCLYVILSLQTEAASTARARKAGHPVILVPGDGGSQLWATLNKTSTVRYICRHKEDLFDLWLNVEELLPYSVDCFVDNIRLVYNNETRTTMSPPGVNVTIIDFGNTTSVEYLDPSRIYLGEYFNVLVDALVAVGYKRGVSVRGAPYDFRKAPNEAGVFFRNLTNLVEETYRINYNRKVVIVAHSLGCLYSLHFLNKQPAEWKAKYIQAFAPIAGPWAGATKSMRIICSGDSLGDILVHAVTARKAQRTWPSIYYLLPNEKYWKSNEVIVQTPKRNYTVRDYHQLLVDLDYEVGWEMFKDSKDIVYNLLAPGVPVYGIHGRDVKTEQNYTYNADYPFPDHQPVKSYGQGDGTVNMRSLKAYLKWQKEQPFPVSEFEISGGEHVHMLQNKTLSKYIIETVLHIP